MRWRVIVLAALSALWFGVGCARAALVGYHDVSDPVKTSGWACKSEHGTAVRVHLYAKVGDVLRHVATEVADHRRDDLAGICGTAAHAFRFADYASGELGAALYGLLAPVTMEVYAEGETGVLELLPGSRRTVSFGPVGLWDGGLRAGRWRTDYENPVEGTLDSPLLLGKCQYSTPVSDGYLAFSGGGFDPVHGCRYQSAVSPSSNSASSHREWPAHSFWAVIANVEDAMLNPDCTNGPPGQSLPLKRPGDGAVFGIDALPDTEAGRPDRMKMHMVLNSAQWAECRKASYGGPYMAFAAQADRGNNGVLTYLNKPGEPTTLRFGMTLMDIDSDPPERHGAPRDSKRYSQSHVVIEAVWGGLKRWVFIELVPDARLVSRDNIGSADVHIRFNWHMYNSMLYPGADYLYKSASVLSAQCAAEKVSVPVFDRTMTYVNAATRDKARLDFAIDIQAVFDCLTRRGEWGAAPMPVHAIPVTSIMFGMEQDDRFYLDGSYTGVSAPNLLWIAVDSVKLN